jgi:hypothetical protein
VIFVHPSPRVQALGTTDSFVIDLNIAPSIVETGKAVYPVGFVRLVSNMTGGPVLAPRDLEVELLSKDTSIALVPPRVVIPAGSDYARFDVDVGYVTGETEISALFGNQVASKNFKVVEATSLIQKNLDLVINLPSNKMQIDAEMPFSVYLENNGNILQASEDVTIRLSYEKSLVQVSSDSMIIKKGSYYAVGTLKSLEKSGNAFIKATTDVAGENLSTVNNIAVSQTQPASLKVYVFPDKVGINEKTIDIFVGVLDDNGHPTLASEDIKLNLFSSTSHLNIDDTDAVIKKGQFGFYTRPSMLFYNAQTVTVGASSSGLGASTATFKVLSASLSTGASKAADKVIKVFTIDNVPSDASSIAVYQLNAVEHDDDDVDCNHDGNLANDGNDCNNDGLFDKQRDTDNNGVIDEHDWRPIDDLNEGDLYPIQSTLIYSKEQGNLDVISSDNLAGKISEPGTLTADSSYGTAVIASGRRADSVNISVSLANAAVGTSSTTIMSGVKPIRTEIFSPAGTVSDGDYRILFDHEGHSDLFFITLDSIDRPSNSEKGVKYLIKPVNELTEIEPGKSFARLSVSSDAFGSTVENIIKEINAIPVGVNADSSLDAKSNLHLVFYTGTTSQVLLPFNSMVGFSKEHQIGTVQLRDASGYPVLASDDVAIRLSSSSVSSVFPTSTVTIPKGKSFANFAITTFGRADNFTISASAEGLQSSSASVAPVLSELSGSFYTGGKFAIAVPSKVVISTSTEGVTVIWGIPAGLQVASKDERTTTYDPISNSFVASAQVLSDKQSTFVIDATLIKDGFKTARISKSIVFEPELVSMKTTIQYDSNAALLYGQATQMSVLVQDADGRPVPGATIQVEASSAAGLVVVATVPTDQNGAATFAYTPTQNEGSSLSTVVVTAYKDGFKPSRDSKVLEVGSTGSLPAIPVIGSALGGLPSWTSYAVIGGVVAASGGFYIRKRSRAPKEGDDDVVIEDTPIETEDAEGET